MTTATAATFDRGSFVAGAEHRTGAPNHGFRGAWATYRTYRRTLAELRALTDRQLADIGLERGALNRVARAAVHEL